MTVIAFLMLQKLNYGFNACIITPSVIGRLADTSTPVNNAVIVSLRMADAEVESGEQQH